VPYTKVKHLCQCCGGSEGVRHLVLMGIISASICKRCRTHFCISEKEAKKGRVDSISKDDRYKGDLRCLRKRKKKSISPR